MMCGMAFQIKDDLFDYTEEKIGKPTGIDIREQKMTLPLIHVLNKVPKDQRKWMINIVKKHNRDKKRVRELINFVRENGGLDYAGSKNGRLQTPCAGHPVGLSGKSRTRFARRNGPLLYGTQNMIFIT